jgi:hypothetical protein
MLLGNLPSKNTDIFIFCCTLKFRFLIYINIKIFSPLIRKRVYKHFLRYCTSFNLMELNIKINKSYLSIYTVCICGYNTYFD